MALGADGAITLQVGVDTASLQQGLNEIKATTKKISSGLAKVGALIGVLLIRQMAKFLSGATEAYEKQAVAETKLETVMRQRMRATDEEIQQIKNLTKAQQDLGVVGDEVQLAGAQQLSTFLKTSSSLQKLIPSMNDLIAQQYGLNATQEGATNIANLFGKAMMGQTSALRRVGITMSEAEEEALKLGNEEQRAAMLAQIVTNNVGHMNASLAQTDSGRQKQLANTMGDVKEAFGAAIQQIGIVFIPLMQKLVVVLATVASYAKGFASSLAALFGGTAQNTMVATATAAEGVATGYSDMGDAAVESGEQAEKAAKKAKKALASFDELNNMNRDEETGSGSGSGSGAGVGGVSTDLTAAGVSPFASVAEFDEKKIDKKLATIMSFIGAALAAIGVMLIFFGHVGWGLAALILGLAVFGVGAAASYAEAGIQNPIEAMLNDLMTTVGLSLAVIGIILIFFGHYVRGVAALIAGIYMFGVGTAEAQEGTISETIVSWIQENGAMIAGISLALLVLGIIILFVTGFNPIGLGLLLAGATGLGISVALNWNEITEDITNFFQENGALIATTSLFLLVIGILLCFSGGGIPVGLGLIAAGAAGLGMTIALNWDAIVKKVKDIGDKIGKVFKAVWDGIVKGFKAMVNGIIKIANIWIAGLNLILAPIRALIVGIAKAFGQNVSMSSVKIPSIPYLAKGGIVPYQTMAMLGEGNKAEAVLPLEQNTGWMDMLADRLASRMGGGGNDQPIVLKLDGREVARAVRGAENTMGNRTVRGAFTNAY